jgi:glutamyl-tRNA reductase
VALFARRRENRDLVPILKALQEHAETVRAAEWMRVRKKLGPLTPEQEQALEALTRSLMQKWLHHPMVELKAASTPAERAAMSELLQRLYALDL